MKILYINMTRIFYCRWPIGVRIQTDHSSSCKYLFSLFLLNPQGRGWGRGMYCLAVVAVADKTQGRLFSRLFTM